MKKDLLFLQIRVVSYSFHLLKYRAQVLLERKCEYGSILWQHAYVSTTFRTLTDCYARKQSTPNGPIEIGFEMLQQSEKIVYQSADRLKTNFLLFFK